MNGNNENERMEVWIWIVEPGSEPKYYEAMWWTPLSAIPDRFASVSSFAVANQIQEHSKGAGIDLNFRPPLDTIEKIPCDGKPRLLTEQGRKRFCRKLKAAYKSARLSREKSQRKKQFLEKDTGPMVPGIVRYERLAYPLERKQKIY